MEDTFGQKLKRWREMANVSQAELARRMEVSPTWISNLERDFSPSAKGGKPQPSIETCDKIARALGVRVAEVRLAAGYAPPGQPESAADLVERKAEITRTAELIDNWKEMSPDEQARALAVIKLFREERPVADLEVERLVSQSTHTKPTRTPSAKIQSPTRKRDKIDRLIDSALLKGGGTLSEKDRAIIRKDYEEQEKDQENTNSE